MAVGVDGEKQLDSLKAEEQGSRRVVVVHQKLSMKGGRRLQVGLVASFAKCQAEDMEGISGWQLGTNFVEDICELVRQSTFDIDVGPIEGGGMVVDEMRVV